jgi:hypothetical protein
LVNLSVACCHLCQVTSFINRFASESASDSAFLFLSLWGLVGINLNIASCVGGHEGHQCQALAGWAAFGRATVRGGEGQGAPYEAR